MVWEDREDDSKMKKRLVFLIATLLLASEPTHTYALNDLSITLTHNSNLNNGIDNPQSDSAIQLQMSRYKSPSGEARTESIYGLNILLKGYKRFTDLNALELAAFIGAHHHINPSVTAELQLGNRAQFVSDTSQSLVELYLSTALTERISESLTLTQGYTYRKAFAKEDTYSYDSHSVSLKALGQVGKKQTIEILYELSYGDSFRDIKKIKGSTHKSANPEQTGSPSRFRRAFNGFVLKEKVVTNSLGASFGVDILENFTTLMEFNYSFFSGRSGVAKGYRTSIGFGLRF